MNEKLEQLMNTLKANKGTVIRVGGVVLGAAIGLTVAAMVVAAQEANFELEEGQIDIEDEEADIEE